MRLCFGKPGRKIIGMEVELSPMYPKTAKNNVIKGRRLDVWLTTTLRYNDGTIERHPGQSWVTFDNQMPRALNEEDHISSIS